MNYDVIIIGAGPGGIYSAYELTHARKDLRVAVFETGNPLHKRKWSHRRQEDQVLHPLQDLRHHERLRRRWLRFPMGNIISRTNSAAPCTSILEKMKPSS